MDEKETKTLVQEIAKKCDWNGYNICEVFLEVLTDANFHKLRKEVAKVINQTEGWDLPIEG